MWSWRNKENRDQIKGHVCKRMSFMYIIERDIDRRRITVSKNWKEGNGYE